MHPTLLPLHLGGHDLSLRSYGAFMLLGYVCALTLALARGPRYGVPRRDLLDLGFWSLALGLLGARLLWTLVQAPALWQACFEPQAFQQGLPPGSAPPGADCTLALRFWEGGLVWYGAVLGASAAAIWIVRRSQLAGRALADLLAPSVALGHAFGRMGCFLAGCCFGQPCALAWAARFPAGSPAWEQQRALGLVGAWADSSLPVHPTQLYEAAGELLLFLLLWAAERRKPAFPGALALRYGFGYGLLRFTVELLRGDLERGSLFAWGPPRLVAALGLPAGTPILLSTSQALSLALLLGCGIGLWRGAARARRAPRSLL